MNNRVSGQNHGPFLQPKLGLRTAKTSAHPEAPPAQEAPVGGSEAKIRDHYTPTATLPTPVSDAPGTSSAPTPTEPQSDSIQTVTRLAAESSDASFQVASSGYMAKGDEPLLSPQQKQEVQTALKSSPQERLSLSNEELQARTKLVLQKYMIESLPAATREQVRALLSPEVIGTMTVLASAYGVAHLTGAPFVADLATGAAIGLAGVGLGASAYNVTNNVMEAVDIISDPKGDLKKAGEKLAAAVSEVGIDAVLAYVAVKSTKIVSALKQATPEAALRYLGGLRSAAKRQGSKAIAAFKETLGSLYETLKEPFSANRSPTFAFKERTFFAENQVGKFNGRRWSSPSMPKDVPSPIELSRLKGTFKTSKGTPLSGAAAFDRQRIPNLDLSGASIQDIVRRIPPEAQLRELKDLPNSKGLNGFEYAWEDTITGDKWAVRFHEKHADAPVGSNSHSGRVFVIERHSTDELGEDIKELMDPHGNFHNAKLIKNKNLRQAETIWKQAESQFDAKGFAQTQQKYEAAWADLKGNPNRVKQFKQQIQAIIDRHAQSNSFDMTGYKQEMQQQVNALKTAFPGQTQKVYAISNLLLNNRSSKFGKQGTWLRKSVAYFQLQQKKNAYDYLLRIGNDTHIPERSNPKAVRTR